MASFRAIIAPTPSAIKISGDGNGGRILLEVCETELGDALELLALRNVLLKVTIEPCIEKLEFEKQTVANGESELGEGNQRQSERETAETSRAHGDTRTRWQQDG